MSVSFLSPLDMLIYANLFKNLISTLFFSSALEFFIQVTAEPVIWTGHDHTILTQTYRAPTTEKKLTWKNILEQRMNALIHRPGDDLLEEVPVGTLAIL